MLLPGEGPVEKPNGADLHYEVELGVIIGKKFSDLDPDDDQAAIDVIESMYLHFSLLSI
jgi:acylpyruvate hydrolase